MSATAHAARPASVLEFLDRNQGLLLTVAVVALPLGVIVGIPPALLDVLLLFNLAGSVLVLATSVTVQGPLQFSTFPSLLLVTTLFRLVLNLATTRLILGNGAEGDLAAGHVVRTFGSFVAGENELVGFILFSILVVIQFVVITKGAGRVSEVAARFALDGMPGRQMSIDADLNGGLITAEEAMRRRRDLTREADFYGAMDGASKFVRGDAIVGLVILVINIVGGLAIGIFRHGMAPMEAVSVFTRLTIGDGLVTQLPAVLVSLAAGFVVTRSTAQAHLGQEVSRQLLSRSPALWIATAFLGVLLLTPLPKVAVLGVGAGFAMVAYGARKKETTQGAAEALAAVGTRDAARASSGSAARTADAALELDPLEVEVGASLLKLADPSGSLLVQIGALRREVAEEMGLLVPPIRVRDNLRLGAHRYAVKLRGVEIARGDLVPAAAEPLVARLRELISAHLPELLTRLEMNALLDRFRAQRDGRGGKLVDEVLDRTIRPADFQKILQNLLREGVPIRDLETILETVADRGAQVKDPAALTERVRQALARTISRTYQREGTIRCVALGSQAEDAASGALLLSPREIRELADRIGLAAGKLAAAGFPPVALCAADARAHVKTLADQAGYRLAVLSYDEIAPGVRVEAVERVDGADRSGDPA